MEYCLHKNLALLLKRQPQLADLIDQTPSLAVEVFPSVKGIPTARYTRKDGTMVPLHSRYDPLKEARENLGKLNLNEADYFILLGFGLGYNLDALLEVTNPSGGRYFVIESDPAILKAALAARDLTGILTLPHVHFAWPSTNSELSSQWATFFDPVYARGSVFVNHIPSISIAPEHFKSAAQAIQSKTYEIFTDINTLVHKSKAFLDNFVENLPLALESPGVSEFVETMAKVPAVIISAGPSLDRNIHELRGCEEQVLLLATDTSLKPLLAAGVKPHFVLSGDPSHENYLHVKGADIGSAIFVVEATGSPEVFKEFRGRTVTCAFENSSLHSLTSMLGRKGTLRAWGSVATMALDFALMTGCDPVIFVGQDLAHTDGRTYCSGLYWEEQVFADVTSPEQWRARWDSLRAGKNLVTMPDIFGNTTETTDKLAAYWSWFSKEIRNHPGMHFVNATEGGILRDGVEIVSLREALYRYGSSDLDLRRRAQSIFAQAQTQCCGKANEILGILARESANIREVLIRGQEICARPPAGTRDGILGHLERIRNSIYANPHVAPLLDSLNQMGNITFLRARRSFKTSSGDPADFAHILNIHQEYFRSVLQALETVESALARLAADSIVSSS